MHSPQLPHAFSRRSKFLILIYLSSLTQLTTNTFICTLTVCTLTVCTLTVCTPTCIHPCTQDPHTLSFTYAHSLTHSLARSHTLPTTHPHTYTNKYMNSVSLTLTRTPQQVKTLLASGIKPDGERDNVSVFWCRLD